MDTTKKFVAESDDREEALNSAIGYCIENHILEEFLRNYRSEVLGMLLDEFDVKKYERSLREEGFEEGLELGEKRGLKLGREKGQELKLIQQVYKKYAKNHRVEEASEMLEEDTETIQKIYEAIKTVGTNDIEEIYKQYIKIR